MKRNEKEEDEEEDDDDEKNQDGGGSVAGGLRRTGYFIRGLASGIALTLEYLRVPRVYITTYLNRCFIVYVYVPLKSFPHTKIQ